MITKQEIMDFAREFSLNANTVEKDYVLGWLLAGISHNSQLTEQWIFKGGTCLKKCYFETYRFSEDLDYTLIDEKHLDEQFLVDNFKEIATWIENETGIHIPLSTIRFEIYQNNAGKISAEGRISYIGPLQRRQDPARIKLDLTADELLVLSPVRREVHHPYSDKPENGIHANCYSFPEIFAEKIRALVERVRPRDLYDVVHLYRHAHQGEKPTAILETLKKKCDYKKISVPILKDIETHSKYHELETTWKNMLGHQLPMLPPWEQFRDELPNIFSWLHGVNKKVIQEPITLSTNTKEKYNDTWRPPSMIQAWNAQIPFELIRYAAANHLCIELAYDNSKRLIEPYDLKQTQEGNLILVAIKHSSGETRSYRLDRIQGIKITTIPFVPRYAISLTPFSETLIATPFVRTGSLSAINNRVRKRKSSNTYKYIIQCNYCGKKFKRSKPETGLKKHKDKSGYPCSGKSSYRVN